MKKMKSLGKIGTITVPVNKTTKAARQWLADYLFSTYGGYSTQKTHGAWLNSQGKKDFEENRLYSIGGIANKRVMKAIAFACLMLSQEEAIYFTFNNKAFLIER